MIELVVPPGAARSQQRARRAAFGLAWVALLVLAPRAVPAAQRAEGPTPWRVGGRVGFTLDTAVFPDSAGYHLEVYLRVPPATLQQLGRDEQGDAHLRATVKASGRGAGDLTTTQDFPISSAVSELGQGRVLLFHFPVTPGTCKLSARLDDLLSHKRGLVYSGKDQWQNAEIRGEIPVPRPQAGRDISDPEFMWPIAAQAPGIAFVRGGRTRLPNPDRLYGLYAQDLETAFTARAKAGDVRPWHWVVRVFDSQGRVVAQAESTSTAGQFAEGGARFDLRDQPAGGYQLDVKAWQEGDAGALQRRSKFSIGWDPETWNRNAADIADDVHFLLGSDDEDQFATLQPGEQEKQLAEFWKKRDPTPETAVNENLLAFRERVDHVNEHYSQFGIAKGMYTDMGRTYIRYGAPTEVLKQVMPAGQETLSKALEEIILSEQRTMGEVNQKGPGGDQRPYEIWIYEGEIPLPFDAEPSAGEKSNKRRLLFLFVDEQGLGTYTLRYSTE